MGLIARELEQQGITTVSLSSARSITAAVNPPRAVFVDFPLGHTAGKRGDRPLQRRIMEAALDAATGIAVPGTIVDLPERWSDDDRWKQTAMRPSEVDGDARDDRRGRTAEPQYQYPEDRAAAEQHLSRD